MNRSKRAMSKQLRKKMAKEIRLAQASYPVRETHQYSDTLTPKELLKKYPSKVAKKHAELLRATEDRIAIKKKKKKHHKIPSKRTTPGLVPSDSPMAHIHPEGKRWIKTLIKQNLTERTIQTHKAGKRNPINRKK